jgi:ATP-dependent Clp protease adaptor protein ClpS
MTSRGHTWTRWYGDATIPTNASAAARDSIGRVTLVRASTAPVEVDEPTREEHVTPEQPWIVIVWNDPINLMTYVVYVFQKLFGYSREKATSLMLDVHHKGRAVVSNGTREKAELDVFRLHEHGLWATLQQDT